MVMMMQPALSPILWQHCKAFRESETRYGAALIACIVIGYFTVWAFVWALVYALAIALSIGASHFPAIARSVPQGGGVILLVVGWLQLKVWAKRHRRACTHMSRVGIATLESALRRGLGLGIHCAVSCLGLTCLLVANGVMDWSTMAITTTAVMYERFMPLGQRVTSAIGFCLVALGIFICLPPAGLP
jgi:predicted metal-binding membrane protein